MFDFYGNRGTGCHEIVAHDITAKRQNEILDLEYAISFLTNKENDKLPKKALKALREKLRKLVREDGFDSEEISDEDLLSVDKLREKLKALLDRCSGVYLLYQLVDA